MNIRRYIDRNLIDEHAYKSFRNGYSLDVSDIPEHDITNFLDILFKHDDVMRELVLDRMQTLIDERLPLVECEAKYDSGLTPIVDKINGEIFWVAKRGAA